MHKIDPVVIDTPGKVVVVLVGNVAKDLMSIRAIAVGDVDGVARFASVIGHLRAIGRPRGTYRLIAQKETRFATQQRQHLQAPRFGSRHPYLRAIV